MSAERTLGSELRSARLGYRWLDQVQRYVRVSETTAPPWRRGEERQECWSIEWVTPDHLPSRPSRSENHLAWWEVPGADAALAAEIEEEWRDHPMPEAGGFTHCEPRP